MSDEAINDINIIAGCLKLWFRELPEPLMTHELYQGFIDAASESMPVIVVISANAHKGFALIAEVENDRLRHIR